MNSRNSDINKILTELNPSLENDGIDKNTSKEIQGINRFRIVTRIPMNE